MSTLTNIRGIGPKTAELLNEKGIYSAVDLAKVHPDDLADIPGDTNGFIVRAREIVGDVSWEPKKVKVKSGQGEGVAEVYELEVEYHDEDLPRDQNSWHPLSPYAGHPVPDKVQSAVAALRQQDLQEGKSPIMTNHVMTYSDRGDRIVLSCEPGGKRVYHRR